MAKKHPKHIRRHILKTLYERYQRDPLDMLTPEDLLADADIDKEHLMPSAHYLSDRGLVELMMAYRPPMFAAARITADGIDLVENETEFNLRFPPDPGSEEEATSRLAILVERLSEEAEFAPLDGESRRCLLRDIQYLRDELARPPARWRIEVIRAVLGWLAAPFSQADLDDALPSRRTVCDLVEQRLREEERNGS